MSGGQRGSGGGGHGNFQKFELMFDSEDDSGVRQFPARSAERDLVLRARRSRHRGPGPRCARSAARGRVPPTR
ncbi:hypothetical protein, partial [Pseudonocardia nigra]|uniref:hypothetical protein n=1 Tax=Pseudonocardia nigra TaxID=1921578 RepID=UPI001C5CD987